MWWNIVLVWFLVKHVFFVPFEIEGLWDWLVSHSDRNCFDTVGLFVIVHFLFGVPAFHELFCFPLLFPVNYCCLAHSSCLRYILHSNPTYNWLDFQVSRDCEAVTRAMLFLLFILYDMTNVREILIFECFTNRRVYY